MFTKMDEKILLEQQSHNLTASAVGNGVCYVCNSDSIITDHKSGVVVCNRCGLVISDKIQV
ncbi:MAG: TFIIB-type zinc ribbon-containing protein [Candidatus Nitrosopolaris sp.]